jgi:hypothetical protein
MRHRRPAALAVFALAGTLAVPATAAGPTIRVAPDVVQRGHTVQVSGAVPGCPHGDAVTLISRAFSHRHEFAGLPAVFATVGAHSRYSLRTRIPGTRAAGRYPISGRCGGGNLGVSVTLRVLR